jgi:hypothetical protein
MTTQQMDRLAAEKVMLWRANEMGIYLMTCRESASIIKAGIVTVSDWSPTTNEQHAAMVREKMAADGWLVNTCVHDGEWSASVWRQGAPSFVVTRDKPMMTYCLTAAALLAVSACTEEDVNG